MTLELFWCLIDGCFSYGFDMSEENLMEWVARVGNADTPVEALAAYLVGASHLQDYSLYLLRLVEQQRGLATSCLGRSQEN